VSDLADRLQADLTDAIRARDGLRSATLRLALAAVHAEEVAGKARRELTDSQVVQVLVREGKKRREAATAYDDGGRPERAQRERDEAEVLAAYLPAQLSDAELDALVTRVLDGGGWSGQQQMGQAMRGVKAELARVAPGGADGGRVAAAVRRRLTG